MKITEHSRVVITGAGSGLGAALSDLLAARGCSIIAADIHLAGAEETARRGGSAVHPVHCDVAKIGDVESLADSCKRLLGGVDLVINNAGVAVVGKVGEVALADWRWIVDINLWGVIHGCHVFAPILAAQNSGHILNVASAAGLLAPPMMAPYSVTKAGVIALSETMRSDLETKNVGVTVLCPTFFRTNLCSTARTADESLRSVAKKLVEGSGLSAEAVARAALSGVETNALYVTPQLDSRIAWGLKRAAPTLFHRFGRHIADIAIRKLTA